MNSSDVNVEAGEYYIQGEQRTEEPPVIESNHEVTQTNGGSEKTKNQNVSEHPKKAVKDNISMTLISAVLLCGPMLMGIGINSVGNENPIRSHFAIQGGFTNCPNSPNRFPSGIWSFGFMFPLGGFIGSLVASFLVDRIGRRKTIFILCISMIFGAVLKIISRSTHYGLMFVGRLFDGVATGGFMVATVLLLLESVTETQSTFFKPLIQVSINAGILLMGILSMNRVAGDNWHMIHIMAIAVSVLLILALFYHPESPKYVYSSTRNIEETSKVFKKLRGEYYNQEEVESLRRVVEESSNIKTMSYREFLSNKVYRHAILSCGLLHAGQQLCGINAIMAFAPSLLASAGFKDGDAGGCIIFTVSVIGSVIFAPVIQAQPRKLLWLIGFVVMVISFSCLMICVFASAPSGFQIFWLCLFVFIFQIGPGPMVWFISLEVFPPQAIGVAQGICTAFNWLSNTLVYLLFPILLTQINIQVIFIFIAIEVIIIIVSVYFVAETCGRTSGEVLDEYCRLYGIKFDKK